MKRLELGDETVLERIVQLANDDPQFEKSLLLKRLRLGDESAYDPLLALAQSDAELGHALIGTLPALGNDSVTTLCLIAKSKLLSGHQDAALGMLIDTSPPEALPILVRALDDPRTGVRYRAYRAIERITVSPLGGGKGKLPIDIPGFLGVRGVPHGWDSAAPTTHSQRLCDEVKQWWEAEGKRQFGFALSADE